MNEINEKCAPKVFISHSSADKQRFVLDFAGRLRQSGVDAWVDCWEMNAGDSLVEKVFDQGLKDSDAVIVVLSNSSIGSRWVREELNTAVVNKINRQIKLIPVRLDNCEVPECLTATLWKDISNPANYEHEFAEIVDAVFGHKRKPPLGEPPPYVRADSLPGLKLIDSLVLAAACENEIRSGLPMTEREVFLALIGSQGVDVDQVIESQEFLQSEGFVKLHYTIGRHPQTTEVLPSGFDLYAESRIPEMPALIPEVGRRIVREEQMDNRALAEALNQPLRIVTHILAVLEGKGWIETGLAYGAGYHHVDVLWASPALKRWLDSL